MPIFYRHILYREISLSFRLILVKISVSMGFHEQGVSKATVFRDNALPPADGADGIFMPIAQRSAEEYPRSTRNAHLSSPPVRAHVYAGGLHHAAQRCRTHRYLRHRSPLD